MEVEGKRRGAACRKRLHSWLVAGGRRGVHGSTAPRPVAKGIAVHCDCVAGVGGGCSFAVQTDTDDGADGPVR